MSLNLVYTPVSWMLLRWHQLFSALGLNPDGGITWTLSIIFLVITARLLLVRLFIKQVHYTRNMQRMQPKIAELREKYKHDRAELNRQMIKLQQDEGFNAFSGCLPMLLQIPVFLGLYHVLRHLSAAASPSYQIQHPDRLTLYSFTRGQTLSAAHAKLLGNVPLAASFHDPSRTIVDTLSGQVAATRLVITIVLLLSATATLGTQLLIRANATTAPQGTAATVQRLMLWIIPLSVLASGLLFNFPLGVLLYWLTSNLWTLAQQGYIIRYHPPTDEPGSPATPRPDRPVGGGSTTDQPPVPGRKPRVGQRPTRPANLRNRRPRASAQHSKRRSGTLPGHGSEQALAATRKPGPPCAVSRSAMPSRPMKIVRCRRSGHAQRRSGGSSPRRLTPHVIGS